MFQAPTMAILPSAAVVRLHLFRHGEVESKRRVCRGQSETPLSAKGLADSLAAAQALVERVRPDLVISSDLTRCRPLAEAFGLPVRWEPRLREQHMGDWEGRDWEELTVADAAAVTAYWADYVNGRPTGGETWAEAYARVVGWWEAEKVGLLDQRVVVVGHVGTLRALFCHWLGLGPGEALRFAPATASHSQVLWAEAGAVFERMGEVG